MASFQMVGTRAIAIAKAQPFENLTISNPTFKKSGFQMVGLQISTVLVNHHVTYEKENCWGRGPLPIRLRISFSQNLR